MRLQGWILDLYPSPQGMTLWLIETNQKRHRLIDPFSPACYVHGSPATLRRLQGRLEARGWAVTCRLTERTDLWQGKALPVLQVSVQHPTEFNSLVRWVHRFDSHLRLYNSDLMLGPRYCWERQVFPLARVEVAVDEHGRVCGLERRDDEWALDYELPPFKIMRLRLEGLSRVNPTHGRRSALEVEVDGDCYVMDESGEPAVVMFQRLLRQHDPDLILSEWGDSTILPLLGRQARQLNLPLQLNRDPNLPVHQSRARSFMSYGRILFKDSATTLYGRLHVDVSNSFIAGHCELDGLWELARVTKLPLQYAARTTTGTGISYMQMEVAYRDRVLIPEQKSEPEDFKHPDQLLIADRGGLVFPPILGFHENVAELDFPSQFPSIMVHFNVSSETVNCPCCPQSPPIPELGYRLCRKRPGIVGRTVAPLIEKRQRYKELLETVPASSRREQYKRRREAAKWLLVCCFGYLGYKNARLGKIEAHESINAIGREQLLVAKETAEQRGFRVLHAVVDSLYVQRERSTREDYERLAEEIHERTGLPISLQALYRYIVFLPSKQFEAVPVPNRFFAVSEESELKVRGLESRRHDTAPFVARMQQEVLAILAEARDSTSYRRKLAEARAVLARYQQALESGAVTLEDLVISKRLTRPPRQYQKASLTAIAAQQLAGRGVKLRPGQTVDYIITDAEAVLPNDRVRAYTLWEGWCGYDREKYREMLVAAFAPFQR
ncbi:MAG: DNA polymerase domain-containing protein [Terriglobia bacterium]